MTHRLALVTGAAGGIGAAVVRVLAQRGTTVAACDLDTARIPASSPAHEGTGAIHPFRLDVTDADEVERVVETVEAGHGPITMLANVAGVLRTAHVHELGDADWQAMFAVNSTGVMHVSRAVGTRMARRGHGAVVTVGSNAGAVPRAGMAAYCASKAAARMFTQVLGLELARAGVRANVVSPGSTDTAMLRDMLGGASTDALINGDAAGYKTGIPLGRIAGPQAIADAVAFLLSDAAAHITLHDLRVDGGASLDH